MNKEYLEAKAEDISKLLYEVYDVPSGICEQIKNMVQRLEAIDNANPSEALECLNKIVESFNETTTGMYGLGEVVVANDLIYGFKEELETIKQALLKAEQDKKKLNEIEKLTYLLYSKRRKIGQEYIKWCEKNNVVFDDATNMITWVLAIKLKEWLK